MALVPVMTVFLPPQSFLSSRVYFSLSAGGSLTWFLRLFSLFYHPQRHGRRGILSARSLSSLSLSRSVSRARAGPFALPLSPSPSPLSPSPSPFSPLPSPRPPLASRSLPPQLLLPTRHRWRTLSRRRLRKRTSTGNRPRSRW